MAKPYRMPPSQAVISSSTDTFAVQSERKSIVKDTPRPPAGNKNACQQDNIKGDERELSIPKRLVVSRLPEY